MPTRPSPKPDPGLAEAVAALRARDFARARTLFLAAAQRRPREAAAHAGAGIASGQLGALDESIDHLRRATELDPRRATYHHLLGIQLRASADFEAAAASFERASWLDRAGTRSGVELAATLEQAGQRERALRALDDVLKRDPSHARAHVIRARIGLRAGPLDAEALEPMRAELEQIAASARDELTVGEAWDALGEVRERLGDYAGAFDAFVRQNQAEARRNGIPPSGDPRGRAQFLDQIDAQHAGLTREMTERWAAQEPDDGLPSPSLLVGFPRSGTTLTERAIGAHPRVRSIEERRTFETVKLEFMQSCGRERVERATIVELLDGASSEDVGRMRARYWQLARDALGGDPDPGTVVLDKMPLRITELSFVNRVFPRAGVLVALRDPRDVCLSCFRQRFVLNRMMSFFLDLEATASLYAHVMGGWLAARDLYSLPWHEIRYRDTVTDFEGSLREALKLLELDWDDAIERFHETTGRSASITPSYHAVRRKVHTGALGRWKRYEPQLSPILPTLEPFVEAFGFADVT